MTEEKTQPENKTKDIKLYSLNSINVATFLGGPLAGAYMISQNFKALKQHNEAKNALIIGVLATVIIFGSIFLTPENIIEKIPRQIIPIIYTSIMWGITEWKQGEILKKHKENDNSFFSGWKSFGIAVISLLILSIVIFGSIYLKPEVNELTKYDDELAKFTENETETLSFYDHIDTASKNLLLYEVEDVAIPKWKENIDIIKNANKIENLPVNLLQQNIILLEYSELRLRAFELFQKAIKEDTPKHSKEIENIHSEIDARLNKLNK